MEFTSVEAGREYCRKLEIAKARRAEELEREFLSEAIRKNADPIWIEKKEQYIKETIELEGWSLLDRYDTDQP